MKTTDLFTKQHSDTGKPMTITLPNGKKIEETLTVLGADSDTFRAALAKSRKAEIELIGRKQDTDPVEYAKEDQALRRKLVASLVSDWSFDEPCTPEGVEALFQNAPYIMEQVDSFAGNRSNFFVMPSMD